jgi:hypothetical protein
MIGGLSNTVTTLSLNDLPSAAPEDDEKETGIDR